MFEIIFIITLSLYFIQSIIFVIGASKKYPKLSDNDLPSISIIVAARNEENNILECLDSLNNLEYPEDKIEIVIVNDKSTDTTGDLIERFISDKRKFRSLIPKESIGDLRGKANAIANALRTVKNEVVLTTDADCIVSPTWAKTLASYYKKDVAMVGGYTDQFDRGAFSGMQSVDFIYLLTVAAGAMNLGKPLSCIGNNMSYRKSVYDEVGGYESLPFSVTEDFNLLMAIHKLKKYKIITPPDSGGLVTSKPCDSIKSLFLQKKRWGVGGIESDLAGYLVMTTGFITHSAVILSPFFYSPGVLVLMFFKFFIDYFLLKPVYSTLKLKLRFSRFLVFEIYFIIYVILLPFILLFNRKVKWKGREF